MDELEKGLTRRDRRFVVRLVLQLAIAVLAGVWFMAWLANQDVGGCAARGFGTLTETPMEPPSP